MRLAGRVGPDILSSHPLLARTAHGGRRRIIIAKLNPAAGADFKAWLGAIGTPGVRQLLKPADTTIFWIQFF